MSWNLVGMIVVLLFALTACICIVSASVRDDIVKLRKR